MSGVFHGVYPQFAAFVYDPADGATLVTEKIVAVISGYLVDIPTDVAIDENGVLTFSGSPDYYPDGQFTANPGDVISYNFGPTFISAGPLSSFQSSGYTLIGPYDPSLPGA